MSQRVGLKVNLIQLIVIIVVCILGTFALWPIIEGWTRGSGHTVVKATPVSTFDQQVATNTGKTSWTVTNRDVSYKDSFLIYEFVLISSGERLVIRKMLSPYETSDIVPGDSVKLSLKDDYKSEYNSDKADNPYIYNIQRVEPR